MLPGVGAFGRCMEALRRTGLDELAHEAVDAGRPFLGICIGMQMLFEASEETPGASGPRHPARHRPPAARAT